MAIPRIYRVMKMGEDEKPVVDASGKGLGVRDVPVNGVTDVDLDFEGNVLLNEKGMSVAPAWRDLPYFLIPKRLREKVPRARASSDLVCFAMGEGLFEDGPLAAGLLLKKDTPTHGNVIPQRLVPLERFQTDLAETRVRWERDEA